MTERGKVITAGYVCLILLGYLIGQYPYIPSFEFWFIKHTQPQKIEIFDRCIAATLLIFSVVMHLALFNNKWIRILMIFIVWSFINNFVDEFTGHTSTFSRTEQIGLLLALITTTYLIWKHRRK